MVQETLTHEEALRRCGDLLSWDEMSSISGLHVDYLRKLHRTGQLNLDKAARSRPVQVADINGARKFTEDHPHGGYTPKWRIMTAAEVFTRWWQSPIGRARITSRQHRLEVRNLDEGRPANYYGPSDGATLKPVLSDEQHADIDAEMERGKSLRQATLEQTPAGRRQLERDQETARKRRK
jgi:hypothetical protein